MARIFNQLEVAALVLLITASAEPAGAIDQRSFETLYRAAQAMDRAAVEGVPYDRFSELARNLATELVAAAGHIHGDDDRAFVLFCSEAGLAYGDSLTLWRMKLARSTRLVSARTREIAPLVARYRLASNADRIDVDAAIHTLWDAARKALRKAELLYQGRVDDLFALLEEEVNAQRSREAEEAEHQRAMIERVAEEFDRADAAAKRPEPYEVSPGNWTCPRGYVIRQGKCLSDEDIARLPKVEIGR